MKRVFLFMIISIAAITGRLAAQNTATAKLPDKWTLQQCPDYAKQHNIQLSNLRLSQQSSREDLLQYRGIFWVLPGGEGQQAGPDRSVKI